MERMGDPAVTPRERFTYRQYLSWPDPERWELIDGQAWSMSPAPARRHQIVVGRLYAAIYDFLKGKSCQAFVAPFDVLLPQGGEPDGEVDTVVQPDIVVYCDKSKLTYAGARGAPDLAVEVLSPSTSKKDLAEKFALYERQGVREYWVVDPGNGAVQVWRLESAGGYGSGELRDFVRDASPIVSRVLEGFSVDPAELLSDLD
ncbi:MAG: Uma2 family endonuclease [Treponema sp.]|nr:Uma2 family endonuclease [Treponema sp.]